MPPLTKIIRAAIPLGLMLPLFNLAVRASWLLRGTRTAASRGLLRLRRGDREIRMSTQHSLYLRDTLEHFDFYFEGACPSTSGDVRIVDYSKPAWHDVRGFDLMPVYFNSSSEPVVTANQYLAFANLGPGCVAIDLGAYSALTSILMDQAIGSGGGVVAVEADPGNLAACDKNLSLYSKISGRRVELARCAIWNHCDGVVFSSEGSMGSSASEITGSDRGENVRVPTTTLLALADVFGLTRVDFVKCDIEGAETIALDCPEFFAKFRPKVVVECHVVDGRSTQAKCSALMEGFGYQCEPMEQLGYPLPLLCCTPKNQEPSPPAGHVRAC